FKQTAEPQGKRHVRRTRHQYLIQKHAARRLHYDLRLELDGVLKSWAVPKGPSLDPAQKRLAAHVEDHPIEYGDFEGTIPEGQYGAGTVMLWDRGTWSAIGDARKGYRAGKLKFELRGNKLHGVWNLVRMGGEAGAEGKNWLLIKDRDEAARPGNSYDILKKDRSVATKRSMDEIAADEGEVWEGRPAKTRSKAKAQAKTAAKAKTAARAKPRARARKKKEHSQDAPALKPGDLEGARKAHPPESLSPQLATLVKEVPKGAAWLHEMKFDGYRLLCVKKQDKVHLLTRHGKDWSAKFTPVVEAIRKLVVREAVLDGEIVVLRQNGTTDFQALQNAMKAGRKTVFTLYLFDLLFCEGYDLRHVPLAERKALLVQLLPERASGPLRYSQHIQGEGQDVYEHACRYGMEGIISKQADAVYEQRRTRSWVKVKCLKRQEFVIVGYTSPSGARSHFGALVLGHYDGKELVYAGRAGTGFTEESLKRVHAAMKPLQMEESPLATPLRGQEARGVHWLQPKLVAEVEFSEWTEDGILRHPSFKGLREDKAAKEVTREEAAPTPGAAKPERERKTRKRQPMAGNDQIAGVTLSNPGRVLYPEEGLTKLDLARYYESVGDWILPYVVHRPLAVVRCPEGHRKECFFQKHVNQTVSGAVYGIPVNEGGKTRQYIAIKDLSGLIGLAQMGVLEIHPWGSREDRIEQPDLITFDLDPDPAVAWKEVVGAAHELRKMLEELGLKTFVKTSGGKGLHVVAPLTRRAEWEEVKTFARAVAQEMVRRAPERYIATMSKVKRRGKIFIDYLRNSRGATSVAAYSTRAKPGAPVSTPIAWDELKPALKPDAYRLENLPKRLQQLKQDPWNEFFKTRQSISAKAKKILEM
ncbi:MAG: DNA ligase D, partial [Candidatus Hydrogenedentes bacterium]|nr:DNA ligase D [Candidatus Hydrogenedentota bacterium]